MNNEIRNELLSIMYYVIGKEENKEYNLRTIFDSYERDIERQLKDLEYKKRELENNLDLLHYVKEEIKKKEVD